MSIASAATADWSVDLDVRYVAFGTTYAKEAAVAAANGWPVQSLELGHLGMLQDPAMVAEAVLSN